DCSAAYGGEGYTYEADAHGVVLDTLRDLKRHFNVDTDRVFLFGNGMGGEMALDVGLSHPDLFAGVIPMSPPQARWQIFTHYWRNGQLLPIYAVMGDAAGDAPRQLSLLYREWMAKGYPSMEVLYKGRGLDWFGAELPMVFDWMARKKRANGFPEL